MKNECLSTPARRLLHLALAVFNTGLVVAPLAAQSASVALNGQPYLNQGLVGVGRISASSRDKFGETFGSFSAFTFAPGSWTRNADGSYQGTLYAQPDRGYNAAGTTNYQPRFNKITVTFKPAPAGAETQDQIGLTLADTIRFTESDGTPLTSLDPTSSGSGTRTGFPALPQAYNERIALDGEGIVVNADGSLWVSDEYGPYVYRFSADGKLLAAIRPPEALIPKRNGADSFASNNPATGQPAPSPANPTTGRQNNQGLEGLSVSPDGKTLFALLQSATRQDGGTGGSGPRRNTRLLVYDISGATPSLKGHYIVQLPTYIDGGATRVAAQSEMLAINRTQFLVLARDGNGRGTSTSTSLYRRVVLYDISGATNLVGTAYESAETAVAPGGNLVAGVTPAASADLIDLNASAELAKFGLHNGPADDVNNLSEKWEALALVPAYDPASPNDYFLFVGNDNDFLTTNGFQVGETYNAGLDNDSMVLVYRLTIPGRIVNISSRARLGTGDDTHIVGFIVNGPKPKQVLIRGAGPALTSYGVSTAVADPQLTLFDATGTAFLSNDNWGDSPTSGELAAAASRVGAFSFAQASKDAALLVWLEPGVYTAHLSTASGAAGVGLLEVYEMP